MRQQVLAIKFRHYGGNESATNFVSAKLNHLRSFDYREICNRVIILPGVCVFFKFYRVLSSLARAGVDKFNVRASARKSPRSESRNSKSNKFAVTTSARH